MRDTRNEYTIITENGETLDLESEFDQSEWFIDNYYKGRITRLWINGVEWQEPTE